jgi:YgiT-type zinc finger domain-containing protein
MREVNCNVCGSQRYEQRKVDYLYHHQDKYLLVPNTPVEVCLDCGMIYYDAGVLKKIERSFFAIQSQNEQPDCYLSIPSKEFLG